MRLLISLFILLFVCCGSAYANNIADQLQPLKGSDAKIKSQNALILQVKTDLNAHNWQASAEVLKQLIAMKPDSWEYLRVLGDTETNSGRYQEAHADSQPTVGFYR